MNMSMFVQFLVPALQAVESQLAPGSASAELVAQVLNVVNLFAPRMTALHAEMTTDHPDMARLAADLPPRPWTPESLLEWAEQRADSDG